MISTSKYRPKSKPSVSRPLAPSVTPPACQLPPGGSYKPVPLHIGLCFCGSAFCGIPQSKIKDFCQLPFTREPCGQCPLTISHGNLLRIVTAPPVPGNVTGWKRRTNQSPPCQRGVPRHRRGGGIPRLASFHIGLYFWKVPTVNPSVKKQRFLPAPFRKGALRAVPADNFARESSAYRYCPSSAR